MSSLSITAPQFTLEEERQEQETISADESQAAHGDLYGTTTIPQYSPSSSLEEEFYRALEELPNEEKEGYLEALDRAPLLVEQESNIHWFLRAEESQAWAAAERLVNYWELRRWLFGERAWLPLTATGDGALSPTDVELLETGFCTLLPMEDLYGRGILCFQVPKEKLKADRLAMARVTFYVLSLAMWTRPLVVQNGLVLIADTKHYTMERYDRKFIKCVAYLFTGWHPVVTRAFHIMAPPGLKSCFQLVLPYIKYFMTRHVRLRFQVHRGTTTQCAMDLKEYGIVTPNLPVEMGGYFTREQFVQWLRDFIRPKELQREEEYVASLDYETLEEDEMPEGYHFTTSSDGDLINMNGSLILPMENEMTICTGTFPPRDVIIGTNQNMTF